MVSKDYTGKKSWSIFHFFLVRKPDTYPDSYRYVLTKHSNKGWEIFYFQIWNFSLIFFSWISDRQSMKNKKKRKSSASTWPVKDFHDNIPFMRLCLFSDHHKKRRQAVSLFLSQPGVPLSFLPKNCRTQRGTALKIHRSIARFFFLVHAANMGRVIHVFSLLFRSHAFRIDRSNIFLVVLRSGIYKILRNPVVCISIFCQFYFVSLSD